MDWWNNTQRPADAAYFSARQAQANAMRREMFGTFAPPEPKPQQQSQISPQEAVYWTCKRASLQGWQVKLENRVFGWVATFKRGDQSLTGPMMSDKQPALFQACEQLQPFLEGTTQ